MSRPVDWHLVGLGADPTPGDSWGVRAVASVYGSTAAAASRTRQLVGAVQSSSGAGVWRGEAGDVFRELLGDFPADIQACETSYESARDALGWWAGRLEDHQSVADRGLEQARAADGDLRAAQSALSSAVADARSASSALSSVERDQVRYRFVDPPVGVTAPSATEVARARRASAQAAAAQRAAADRVDDAQVRLDAAAQLVAGAAASYEADAATTITRLGAAHDQALPENDIWEKIRRSGAWQALVVIATVVVVVAAVAAFILTGPIAVIVGLVAVIAGAVLALNDVMEYRAGLKSGWEAALSVVLTVVPGGVLLKAGKSGLSIALRVGLRLAPKATTATSAALRAAARVGSSGLQRITRITEPWVARVNAHLPGGRPLATRIPADEVRFSQKTVSFHKIDRVTGERYTYQDIVDSMASGGWQGDPVDVVRMSDGGFTSIDNTRIRAARATGTPVEAHIHTRDEALIASEIERFSSTKMGVEVSTWGEATDLRIRRQGLGFERENPHGSDVLPRITGAPDS